MGAGVVNLRLAIVGHFSPHFQDGRQTERGDFPSPIYPIPPLLHLPHYLTNLPKCQRQRKVTWDHGSIVRCPLHRPAVSRLSATPQLGKHKAAMPGLKVGWERRHVSAAGRGGRG